jgi:hypothetical protein
MWINLPENAAGCSSGVLAPPKPLNIRTNTRCHNSGLADEAGPVGKRVWRAGETLGQMLAKVSPGFGGRRKTRCNGRYVKQDGFDSLHYRKSGQSGRISSC